MTATMRGPNRRWWVVVAMSGIMILLTVDFFGVAVALPQIGKDLHASTETLAWTVNVYLLAFVSPMIAVGRLADIVGRRKVALVGVVVFVAASVACAAAPTDLFLIGARLVQGLGGGVIFATSLSIVNNAFPPDERPKALGIWSGVGLVGSAVGPMVAGILTQEASWRWFFFLNVPIGIAVIVISLAVVEDSRDETYTGGIDWAGFVTLTLGFAPLIFGLQQGAQAGWSAPEVVIGIVAGVVILVVFVILELRPRRHPPLVEFALFRDPRFTGASAVAFLGNWQFGAILFFLTLYLQEILLKNPLDAGLIFLTFSVPLVVLSPIGGRLVPKVGSQVLMAVGMTLVGAGMLVFAFLDASSTVLLVVVGLIIAGLGQGFAYNVSNTAGMEAMPDEKAGVASGVLQTARLMGIVVGLALSVALFRGLENHQVISRIEHAQGSAARVSPQEQREIRDQLSGSADARAEIQENVPQVRNQVNSIADDAFSKGLQGVMVLGAGLSFAAVWPSLWGRRRREATAHRHGPGFSPAHWRHRADATRDGAAGAR
jgi:EmrB/QacA subfamily drug resistance transporter